jgi:Ca2+-binding RTX toxin-like protein
MFDQITTLGRKLFARTNESRGRRARSEVRLHVEGLEDRKLMTASINTAGTLVISQTNGHDTAYVGLEGNRYVVTEGGSASARKTYFNASHVTSGLVAYYGYGGNDTFRNYTSLRTYAWGGDGNDSLFGGSGNDNLYGERGNDTLQGSEFGRLSGNDWMEGGDGNDYLYGHDGDDVLIGGNGHDFMVGDYWNGGIGRHGDDKLYGDAGDDTLYGNIGNDLLSGGDGNDYLAGQEGDDQLYGGAGRDYLYGWLGNDYADGGGNDDYIDGGAGSDTIKKYAKQRVVGFDARYDRLM